MKKVDLGQTIGILANIGVIAGIVFLAVETRQSSTAISVQTQDSIADGFITLNMATITDPSVGETFSTGLNYPDQLSRSEAIRFSTHMRALFNQYRRVYLLYEAGLIDESDWALYGTEAFTIMSSPGGKLHWANNEMEPEFRAAIERYSNRGSNVDFELGRAVGTR